MWVNSQLNPYQIPGKYYQLTYIPSPTKLHFKIDPILLTKCKLKQFVNENKILGRWAVQVTSFIPHFAKIVLLAYPWFDFAGCI